MLQRLTIPVTAFEQNCSLIWCDETGDAALIDPGGDIPVLEQAVRERSLSLKAIWLTHAHIDHAGGTGTLARTHQLPIVGPHPGDQFWIDGLPKQAQMFGFPQAEPFKPTQWLKDGDEVQLVDLRGSSGAEAMSFNVWALERNQQADEQSKRDVVKIRVLKNRLTSFTGVAGAAIYDHESGRLNPLETSYEGE